MVGRNVWPDVIPEIHGTCACRVGVLYDGTRGDKVQGQQPRFNGKTLKGQARRGGNDHRAAGSIKTEGLAHLARHESSAAEYRSVVETNLISGVPFCLPPTDQTR